MSVVKNSPVFSRAPDKSYRVILSCVGLDVLPLDEFLPNEGDVKFDMWPSEWHIMR